MDGETNPYGSLHTAALPPQGAEPEPFVPVDEPLTAKNMAAARLVAKVGHESSVRHLCKRLIATVEELMAENDELRRATAG